MFTKTFFSEFSDIFVPESMLNIVNDPAQSTRREKNHQLLQARAVVALTFTTIIALAYQLTIDICFHEESGFPITPLTLGGLFLFIAVLYCLPREIITFQQAATIEVYYFLASSCFVVFFGNEGFWKLSHANFFVVPPFSYIFVSRKFGKNITMFVSAIYALSFLSSLGGQAPILGPNQGAWVVLDCYVLSFIYWLFAAYEQEREHNEMMLQKSLDEARSAMSAKSMFISNVSHELRTPLHGILATVEILSNTALTESQRALLNAIESCGTNLISVVNQVLTYAKMEHGKMSLENSTFDLIHLLQEIGDGMAPSTGKKNLELIVTTVVDPLHRFVVGDMGCIRQIVLNLLGNAIKFTDRGRIELTCLELVDTGDGDHEMVAVKGREREEERRQATKEATILIEVIDTGKGIAPEFMNRLYEPFSQEDSSLRRKFEGTGLLDLMKSRLEVQSNYGKGSRFSFKIHLPIAPVMNGLQPSPYPFPQDILKLDQATREYMMSELRARRICISASEEDFLLAERLKTYLQGWDLSFISADKVLTQPCENIRNIHLDCEIVILNDSVDDLRTLLEAFPEYYNKDNPGISNGRQQKTMFFSCVAEYQAAENLLRKYCPFSVVVVTKPAGPSKILEALLKASHWLTCPSDATKPFAPHFIEHACRELLETVFNHPRPKAEVPLEFRTWSPETCSEASFLQGRDEDSGRQRGDEIHMEEITEGKEIQDAEITRRVEEVERLGIEKVVKSEKDVRFLIVEDNKINLMILATFLSQHGFVRYEVAYNGQQAIDKFEGQSFDVIFMDLQMPILDGIEATEQIRKIEAERHEVSNTASNLTSPKQRRAIIIAMTGLAAAEDREAAMSAGCDEFLTKPISLKQLETRLQTWIARVHFGSEEYSTSS